ncbi:hypothetical protein HX746_31550 (plasmid) [Rhodococcus erythropolis]|uniref:hypothetical protein n=1 Tax=Rhodococcus erythropolis TaxID=1833 RepID=UPI001ADC52D9|nr:hypothetical protein [Rhodococcus erythropolis]MBO8150804.1 hypothetical protein [Rhodococcus erythropolis]
MIKLYFGGWIVVMVSPYQVVLWRAQFYERGIEGLPDTPRSGRPPNYFRRRSRMHPRGAAGAAVRRREPRTRVSRVATARSAERGRGSGAQDR